MDKPNLTQAQCEKAVFDWLSAFKSMRALHPKMPVTLDEWVLDNGVKFAERGPLPKGTRVTPKSRECYWNAWRLRAKLKKQGRLLRYCEGYVMHANFIIPVLHGWLLDEQGRVLDTSIELDGAVAYHGVVFDHDRAEKMWWELRRKGAIGILGNLYRFRMGPLELNSAVESVCVAA